jgi:hypothetical protein
LLIGMDIPTSLRTARNCKRALPNTQRRSTTR